MAFNINSILQNLPINPVTLILLVILIIVILVFAAILIRRKRMTNKVKMSKEQIQEDINQIKQEITGKPAYPSVPVTYPSIPQPDFELEKKQAPVITEPKILEEEDIDNNYRNKIRNLLDTLSRRKEKLKLEKKDITDKNASLKLRWEEVLREEKEIDKILSNIRQEE